MASSVPRPGNGRRCLQEMDDFDYMMGFSFKNLTSSRRDDTGEYNDSFVDEYQAKRQQEKLMETTRTAFGDSVSVPTGFVAPVDTSKKKNKKKKSHSSGSNSKSNSSTSHQHQVVHTPSIPPTSPTGSSMSLSSSPPSIPGTARSKITTSSRKPSTQDSSASSVASFPTSKTSSSTKPKQKMDFVYDVDARKKIREDIDHERQEVLRQAKEKEAYLRAQHRWIFDRREQQQQQPQPATSVPKQPHQPVQPSPHYHHAHGHNISSAQRKEAWNTVNESGNTPLTSSVISSSVHSNSSHSSSSMESSTARFRPQIATSRPNGVVPGSATTASGGPSVAASTQKSVHVGSTTASTTGGYSASVGSSSVYTMYTSGTNMTSSTSASSKKINKSSIAPNISDWRTQPMAYYPSPAALFAEQKRKEDAVERSKQKESKETEESIDMFEKKMKHWKM